MDSPIVYPTVSLAGKPYELKLTLGAVYRLEQQGIDIGTLAAQVKSWMPERGEDGEIVRQGQVRIGLIIQILTACIGPTTFSAEQVADMLDMTDLASVCVAVGQAIGASLAKIKPSANLKLREPAATQEQPPIQ